MVSSVAPKVLPIRMPGASAVNRSAAGQERQASVSIGEHEQDQAEPWHCHRCAGITEYMEPVWHSIAGRPSPEISFAFF
jgi:hypothetical protein